MTEPKKLYDAIQCRMCGFYFVPKGWVKADKIINDLEELIDSYHDNDELDWRGVVNDLVSIIAIDLAGDKK
jgi:NMD protein affecting ribosome stability and mRNA decay